MFLRRTVLCLITLFFCGGVMAGSTHTHHGIDYIEFTVTDLAKAKAFYSAAFGWKFNDYGPAYSGIQRENGEAGGLRLDKEVTRGGPLVILYSENLDRSVEMVAKAGGEITKAPFAF